MLISEKTKRIIVRCPNWVGDIVMATPVFDALRKAYPKAEIVALVRKYAVEIIDNSGWFDTVIGIDDKSKPGRKDVVRAIRTFAPEAAIVFPNSWSAVLPLLQAGCFKIYGYKRNGRGIVLRGGPKPIRENGRIKPIPTTDYYVELGRYLGLEIPQDVHPHLVINDQARQRAEKVYAKYNIVDDDIVVGLNPGASFGSSKCWPTKYYAELAERLEKHYHCRLFMFTAPGEESIAQEIMEYTNASVIDMRKEGLGLDLLKPLIKRCKFLVTNDTGPRHYAVALNVPVAVIFGSTDPGLTASNLDKTATIRLNIECSPCQQKICPLGHHKCMQDLTVDIVFDQIRNLVEGK